MKKPIRPYWVLIPFFVFAVWFFVGAQPGRGPYPIPFPTNWPGSAGQAILSAGNGITYLGTVGGGAGLPGTNSIIAYGTAQQTNWSAETAGGLFETNTAGNKVVLWNGTILSQQGITNNTAGALPDIWLVGAKLGFDTAAGWQSAIAGLSTAAAGLDFDVTNNTGAYIPMMELTSLKLGVGPIIYSTNGVQVLGGSPGILVSNTQGAAADYSIISTNSVIWGTNAEQGVWWAFGTNSSMFMSNAIKGAYFLFSSTNFVFSNSIAFLQITNGHIAITNYGAAGERVDIDPSVNGSVLWGDNNQTNYESIGVSGVVVSNAVGFQLFSSDSEVWSNRLTGNVAIETNGTISVAGGIQSTGGSIFLSLNTNNAGHAQQTNALTWSTIQATNEWTFWAFATNLTIAGYQNVENAHMYHGWLCASNGAAGNVTISPPAGVRIMATLTTNQPNNTITVTNGKTVLIEWFLNSHLTQNITQWVVFGQQN